MEKRQRRIYYLILHNYEVVDFASNLKVLVTNLSKKEKHAKTYSTYFRRFAKSNYFKEEIDGKEYHFFKLIHSWSGSKETSIESTA